MHKKSEVDLRVAQELKNNQDFIYETNQKLQSLSNAMIALSLQYEKIVAKSDSERKLIFIEFEKVKDFVVSSIKDFLTRMGDLESNVLNLISTFHKLESNIPGQYISNKCFHEYFLLEMERIESIERKLQMQNCYLEDSMRVLRGKVDHDIKTLKEDLTVIPPDIDPVEKKMTDTFDALKVDMEGLVKEINLLKKSVMYDQKKFENVYTLIERLQKGKQ